MRPPTACVACRNRRRKCIVASPGEKCIYCKQRHIPCSLTASPKASTNGTSWPLVSPTSPTTGDEFELHRCQSIATNLPPRPLCITLTELYFQYIHDTFHSIFHRPSVLEDVANGTLPDVLLFGIISLAARFSGDSFFAGIDPRVRGRPYAQEAEHLLNLREVSLTTIQACVLIGCYAITEGEPGPEAVYYGIACRNALLLNLPVLPAFSRVEQEVNRRVWWTLNMIDVWSSKGVNIPRSITPRGDIPFPMEETVFLQLRREDFDLPSPSSMQESSASLLTQMVKLNAILVEVQNVNSTSAASAFVPGSPSSSFDFSPVDDLTYKLESWHNNLPLTLQDTHTNLMRFAALGLGPMFVAVYLGYYNYGMLLYYQYLHEDCYSSSSSSLQSRARYYANKCKSYSIGLLEILYRAYSTPGCEVYYTMVGHVLVIASTVQLHILLFGASDEQQIRDARSRLEKNFEILTRLQTFWPTLDVSFTRFREFHKACMKSKEASFRMDRWMLQFLFEFAKPMTEKEEDDEMDPILYDEDGLAKLRPWSMVELGFSPF
jgi:Fungal specific transcription factor domain